MKKIASNKIANKLQIMCLFYLAYSYTFTQQVLSNKIPMLDEWGCWHIFDSNKIDLKINLPFDSFHGFCDYTEKQLLFSKNNKYYVLFADGSIFPENEKDSMTIDYRFYRKGKRRTFNYFSVNDKKLIGKKGFYDYRYSYLYEYRNQYFSNYPSYKVLTNFIFFKDTSQSVFQIALNTIDSERKFQKFLPSRLKLELQEGNYRETEFTKGLSIGFNVDNYKPCKWIERTDTKSAKKYYLMFSSKLLGPFDKTEAENLYLGPCPMTKGWFQLNINNKIHVVDGVGQTLFVNDTLSEIQYFSDGMTYKKGGKWGALTIHNLQIPPVSSFPLRFNAPFFETIGEKKEYYFFSNDNKELIHHSFPTISLKTNQNNLNSEDLNESLFLFQKDGKNVFCKKNPKNILIECDSYNLINKYASGLITCINDSNNRLSILTYSSGIINQYDNFKSFPGDTIQLRENFYIVNNENRFAILNRSNNTHIEFSCDTLEKKFGHKLKFKGFCENGDIILKLQDYNNYVVLDSTGNISFKIQAEILKNPKFLERKSNSDYTRKSFNTLFEPHDPSESIGNRSLFVVRSLNETIDRYDSVFVTFGNIKTVLPVGSHYKDFFYDTLGNYFWQFQVGNEYLFYNAKGEIELKLNKKDVRIEEASGQNMQFLMYVDKLGVYRFFPKNTLIVSEHITTVPNSIHNNQFYFESTESRLNGYGYADSLVLLSAKGELLKKGRILKNTLLSEGYQVYTFADGEYMLNWNDASIFEKVIDRSENNDFQFFIGITTDKKRYLSYTIDGSREIKNFYNEGPILIVEPLNQK